MDRLRTPTAVRSSVGRCFVSPLFDVLVIGGGLSLPVTAIVVAGPDAPFVGPLASRLDLLLDPLLLPVVILLLSGTHFAASTVRLYTKPGTASALPFLTAGFPLVALAILTLCIAYPASLGRQLQALYLTWSPYHYAAQAYGLSVMYCYRSGCALDARAKRLLRGVSLLPFLYAFVVTSGAGLHWLLPDAAYRGAAFAGALALLQTLLLGLGAAAPFALYAWHRRRGHGAMPAISLLVLVANGVWWFVLPPLQAFVWATFFHGIQYLAIAAIFHSREQTARGDRRGPLFHALSFYAACLVLAYGLFNCLPHAYALAGFSLTESVLLAVAAINVHHFIVDAYIWRLGRQDSNRAIVDSGAAAAAVAGS
jgi:hypothetical protein